MTVYMTIDLTKDFETYFYGRRIWRKSKLTLQSFLTQFCLTKADQNIYSSICLQHRINLVYAPWQALICVCIYQQALILAVSQKQEGEKLI